MTILMTATIGSGHQHWVTTSTVVEVMMAGGCMYGHEGQGPFLQVRRLVFAIFLFD